MSVDAEETRTPAEARAREAVRSLSRPRAGTAFRARLAQEFVRGDIGQPRTIELAGPKVRLGWLVLAPAALVLALAFGLANRAPAWRAIAAGSDGVVIVDGRPIPSGHLTELSQRLAPGVRLELVGGTMLELESQGQLRVQLTPGTAITLPNLPGRWLGRASRGTLAHGEVRITTGPGFHGAKLALQTPETAIEVVGTTLAVIREPVGTCVCVLDGMVRVGAPGGGTMEMIPGGRRMFMFNDGRTPEHASMRPNEAVELARFRGR